MFRRLFALSFLVVLLATGCGGGGGGSSSSTVQTVSRTISLATSPTLDDGSPYAEVSFLCQRSGPVTVKASSSNLDPMVLIEKNNPDGTQEAVAADDDGAGGTSARVAFEASAGSTYKALVASAGDDADGTVIVEYPSDRLTVVVP